MATKSMSNKNGSTKTAVENVVDTTIDVANIALTIANLVAQITELRKEVENLKSSNVRTVNNRVRENRKYSDQQIREIFKMRDKGMTGYSIAKAFGENTTYIYNVLSRKLYADVDLNANVVDANVADADIALRDSQDTASS